jgi:ligand-binding SRPBCC domain-containing protein
VFHFFSDARNLQQITPSWLDFHVMGMSTDEIQAGTRIDYRLKIHGIPIRWQSEITKWDPPYCFVDRQISGPYAEWRHEHLFADERGGTRCTDRVQYLPPGGKPLAGIINRLFVQRDVRQIFEYRRTRLAELFGTPS